MNKRIILTAETGSDITPSLAEKYGIYLVPMHVSMNNSTYDDGTFPVEDICRYYENTGKVPKTSASSPMDFEKVFTEIHEKYPESEIVHLAYSAVTTASFQSAVIASENKPYVTCLDTKNVSIGQAAVVVEVARKLNANPEMTVKDIEEYMYRVRERTSMCFLPENLDYLRAGGRVSNAVAIAGNFLHLHPCIEIVDGQLIAKKKYRGSMKKLIVKLIEDYDAIYDFDREHIYLIHSHGLDDEAMSIAENAVKNMGFKSFTWMKTGCVITCHGGSGAFGIVGMKKGRAVNSQ